MYFTRFIPAGAIRIRGDACNGFLTRKHKVTVHVRIFFP